MVRRFKENQYISNCRFLQETSHTPSQIHFLGQKVFDKIAASAPPSYKFVNLVFACTGGGTLVPIFINLIPVSLSTDAYPIAIGASFLLHNYVPILREVLHQSDLLKVCLY